MEQTRDYIHGVAERYIEVALSYNEDTISQPKVAHKAPLQETLYEHEQLVQTTQRTMAASKSIDRKEIVPRHEGLNVLPNSPLFTQLLRHARRGREAVRDTPLNISKSYGELLDAVLCFRAVVVASLPDKVLHRLRDDEEVYIGILAAGGYEFTVAALTVLSLGAAMVPMFPAAPLEEIAYFTSKSDQVMILSGAACTELAQKASQQTGLPTVGILPNLVRRTHFTPLDISISSDGPQDPRKPGVVIFTSGTTGKPKGVVLRRTYTHEGALAIGDGFDINHTDVSLHALPVHHTTGLGTSFFPFLMAGACIEFHGKFDAGTVLRRWMKGGLTVFSAVPTIYMRLKWHIEQAPATEQQAYRQCSRQFRALLCGSSALQDNVQDFWTATRGEPILTRYGATEIPGCLRVPYREKGVPKHCVGLPVPGVELKISSEGELLVKSPNMFAKYLMDPEATKAAHDEQGYYRTGDIARREGLYYFIVGRASVDIIKSGGYKISALDVERECLALPYVTEAMVVGVDDEEFGQRVAAVLVVDKTDQRVTISKLRADLRDRLAAYKLPTILRAETRELPKGATGKVQKKILGPKLVPSPGYEDMREVQVYRRRGVSGAVQARL